MNLKFKNLFVLAYCKTVDFNLRLLFKNKLILSYYYIGL